MEINEKIAIKKALYLIYFITSIIVTVLLPIFFKNIYIVFFGLIFVAFFGWNYFNLKNKIKQGHFILVAAQCVDSKLTPPAFGTTSSKIYLFKPVEIKDYKTYIPESADPFEIQIALSNYRQFRQKVSPIVKGEKYIMAFEFNPEKENSPTLSNTKLLLYTKYYEEINKDSAEKLETDNKELENAIEK